MLPLAPLADTPIAALEAAAPSAPYLARLMRREKDWQDWFADGRRMGRFDDALALVGARPETESEDEALSRLRQAKRWCHLSLAGADLSGLDVMEVTRAITRFADAALAAALDSVLARHGVAADGLFVVALGKMGAFELNYSSDIDLAAFYDPGVFAGGDPEAGMLASKVVKQAMALLETQTGDGYVFRTDLRLRPDPSSTPLAVSTKMAELYYESVGQNWERMVWIKARPAAGDFDAAQRFIDLLQPFVWRRHLDYWAIGDVQAIKRMINARAGHESFEDTAADVKLSPGGIREIEFFAQTQQVIMGGRNPALRPRATLDALDALAEAGAVDGEVKDELNTAYRTLRNVEHRIQMRQDEQTHTLPADEGARAQVAALCGLSSLDAFDHGVRALRRQVHGHYSHLFAEEDRQSAAAEAGNLVFTGVDDDPGTVETLEKLGFSNPSLVIETVRRWHRGKTRATRGERGRGLLTALLPGLLRAMAETGEADIAFTRFTRFFEGLSSGVQTLSMLLAEPDLMEDVVATLAIAPRLSTQLARQPALLECLLDIAANQAQPGEAVLEDFEAAMDQVRRWHGERAFLIGHSLLHARRQAHEAALAYSDLADTVLSLMAKAAEHETVRRFGAQPGRYCVAALGKLGGREMTAGSDLDLLVVYEADEDVPGEAQVWYTKFTQRLITALSADTPEGSLYEVDMRLRPSGRAGPVAVSLAAFDRYQHEEAWTWELMALTRLRPVAGDEALGARVVEVAHHAVVHGGASQSRLEDILDMRRRIARERPGKGDWDIKRGEGGLVDLEFTVQAGLLGVKREEALSPILSDAIDALSDEGYLDEGERETLDRGFGFLQALQQVQRLALGDETDPEKFTPGICERLCRAAGAEDFATLSEQLETVRREIAALRCKKIGPLATD